MKELLTGMKKAQRKNGCLAFFFEYFRTIFFYVPIGFLSAVFLAFYFREESP
jgi:hypothetical protein